MNIEQRIDEVVSILGGDVRNMLEDIIASIRKEEKRKIYKNVCEDLERFGNLTAKDFIKNYKESYLHEDKEE